MFQYIGELCRYLVNAETSAAETRHKLRLACGNGLSGSVWEPFERRFKIPRILEFYAATEGNFSLYNCEGKPGAIGRVPAFLTHRFNVKLVALDDATGAPARGLDGHCVPCAPGSIGEAIGEVHERAGSQAGRFEGYTSQSASQQKIIRDVFVAGDAWVRSGDLMRTDEQGFFYFVDRVGDTFRWKGENVATTEVAAAIARCPGVQEATVYGVPVPACEGRAGMAALVVAPAFNLADLKRHLDGLLPDYAQPVFVRLCASLDITTTFRPKKSDLARDGFDPAGIADPVSIRDSQRGYLPLDAVLHAAILQGRMRL